MTTRATMAFLNTGHHCGTLSVPFWRTGTSRGSMLNYDVIVIGGGTAGIPCALCGDGWCEGLIEKSPGPGGTLFWSTDKLPTVFHAQS